jgi:hypothetical protein
VLEMRRCCRHLGNTGVGLFKVRRLVGTYSYRTRKTSARHSVLPPEANTQSPNQMAARAKSVVGILCQIRDP